MSPWHSEAFDRHEHVSFFSDERVALQAIVAVHSTARGPAVGGTRFFPYARIQQGIEDVLRLSRAMSLKCALADLPCGGGKAVLIGDPRKIKTRALLESYGRYLNRIGTTFATGEDVGMTVEDIEVIRGVSPFVAGTSRGAGNPAVHTATGVLHGLRAVLEHRFDRSDFHGIKVAIQGLGAVGWRLAQLLHEAGASLTVADVREDLVQRAVEEFAATAHATEVIHEAAVDIFSPCALGGVITVDNVARIRARAVAGAANNPLASSAAGEALAAREILFAPDYVINAGGVMSGLEEYFTIPGRQGASTSALETRLAGIHDRLLQIFERAEREGRTPEATAERMARELIAR